MQNLTDKIEKRLPAELVSFIKAAGDLAARKGEKLYLVGGIVRDLVLGKGNFDIDLVVEGDAVALARRLAEKEPGEITIHHRFSTAKLRWRKWSVDLATARSESYARPGALPTVRPGSLNDDLFRRDFTINAMAAELSPEDYGKLIDLYGGMNDLEHKIIRILHDNSFVDDATRIWRAVRYEQRLGFKLEPNTLGLLRRDIPMLDTISGDRIRYELECVLSEGYPERVFRRAGELGVLNKLGPSLRGNGWLEARFDEARRVCLPHQPPPDLYLALFTYHLTDEEKEKLISFLRLPKTLAQTLRDSGRIRTRPPELASPTLKPSHIYHLLHGYALPAITANLIASESPEAHRNIRLYLDKLRLVKSRLTGDDLINMGIAPGPRIKEILNRLLDARLDGEVKTRQDEEKLVREWMESG